MELDSNFKYQIPKIQTGVSFRNSNDFIRRKEILQSNIKDNWKNPSGSLHRTDPQNKAYYSTITQSTLGEINSKIAENTNYIIRHSMIHQKFGHLQHQKHQDGKKRTYLRKYVRFQSPKSFYSTKNVNFQDLRGRKQFEDGNKSQQKQRQIPLNYLYDSKHIDENNKSLYSSNISKRSDKLQFETFNQTGHLRKHVSPELNPYKNTDLILSSNKNQSSQSSVRNQVKFNYINRQSDFSTAPCNQRPMEKKMDLQNFDSFKKIENYENNDFQLFKRSKSEEELQNFLQNDFPHSKTKEIFYPMNDHRQSYQPGNIQQQDAHQQTPVYKKDQTPQLKKIQQRQISMAQINRKGQIVPEPVEAKVSKLKQSLSKIRDRESQIIAISLISLAVIIFVLQLLS